MKTIIKKMLAFTLVGLGLAVVGCAQDNESNMQTDPSTGKKTEAGVTPPTAHKSSKDFYNNVKSPMNDPANTKKYKDSQN
jgi:hypothetical protein